MNEKTDREKQHLAEQLDHVRRMVRKCSEERMPQGACAFCLQVYRVALNAALDEGVFDIQGGANDEGLSSLQQEGKNR